MKSYSALALLALAMAVAAPARAAHEGVDEGKPAGGGPLSNFTLPTLPFEYDEFEPSIDNATMWLHWNR